MKRELSILIPAYNHACNALVEELCEQASHLDISFEVVVAEDGSTDEEALKANARIARWPNCRYLLRQQNVGRARIRNFLAQQSRYEWLLFLDCDMSIPSARFIKNYIESDVADVAYGGYVVGTGETSNLRYRYEKACEHMHRAEIRAQRPYMHFHTCNFLVRRDLMLSHPFDERFHAYGYEDVLFGKQLRKAGITIDHLDNPTGFFDFEDNAAFVSKTEEGLRTLHAFRADLRGYSQLLTFVDGIHLGIVRWLIRLWHRLFGGLERRILCSKRPSLRVFSLYRLGYFLEIREIDKR